ncbi:MAG: hypothetical protein P4L28_00530 [Paludibacteraceae bacterium]|nr:hypothetical protein [Paludibacteraceae bacterium]
MSSIAKFFLPYKLIKVTLGENSYINGNSQASNLVVGKYTSIGPNFFCGCGIHPINGLSIAPSFIIYDVFLQKLNYGFIEQVSFIKKIKRLAKKYVTKI